MSLKRYYIYGDEEYVRQVEMLVSISKYMFLTYHYSTANTNVVRNLVTRTVYLRNIRRFLVTRWHFFVVFIIYIYVIPSI